MFFGTFLSTSYSAHRVVLGKVISLIQFLAKLVCCISFLHFWLSGFLGLMMVLTIMVFFFFYIFGLVDFLGWWWFYDYNVFFFFCFVSVIRICFKHMWPQWDAKLPVVHLYTNWYMYFIRGAVKKLTFLADMSVKGGGKTLVRKENVSFVEGGEDPEILWKNNNIEYMKKKTYIFSHYVR